MYNLAICFTYFIEMLISYSFFSLIGEKKLKVPICFFVGTVLFLSGAFFDIILSNVIWFNALYFSSLYGWCSGLSPCRCSWSYG